MQKKKTTGNDKTLAFLLLTLLIFIVYGNSFRAGWHFDDNDHIINNPAVHLTRFSFNSVDRALHAAPRADQSAPQKIYRPLAGLSFALNWYFGRANVFGYHLVNVAMHCLAAFFLFLSIAAIYKTPRMESVRDGQRNFVPLLAATLWALSPIQTQAVTYIVQRMASMAAMFCILGFFLYLKGRVSKQQIRRVLFFIGAGLAFVCALGSKENAIIFPFSLLLVEIVFFQSSRLQQIRKKVFIAASLSAFLIAAVGLLLFSRGVPLSVFNGYGMRPYTLIERLMTQPRVLLFYLSEIFYPIATRLSFQHDIFHSTTLLTPWTTLPCALLVLSLIVIACIKIRRWPLLSFAILFFFLNHLVESSILPLELVFEHRNYMPSMFLFMPASAAIWRVCAYYRSQKSSTYYILVGFISLLIAGFGLSTHVRNMAWATDMSLWQDAIKKAPGSIRPYIGLGRIYQKLGENRKALNFYRQSVDKYSERPKDYRVVILNNVGNIYFTQGKYDQAIKIWSDTIRRVKDYSGLRSNLVLVFAKRKQWDRALAQLDHLLKKFPDNPQYNFMKGSYLIKTGQIDVAIPHLRKALQAGYNITKTLATFGVAYYLRQNYEKAEHFLRWSASGKNKNPEMLLWLLAVNLKLGDPANSEHYAEQLVEKVSISGLNSWLELIADADHYLYRDKDKIIACLQAVFPRKFQPSIQF